MSILQTPILVLNPPALEPDTLRLFHVKQSQRIRYALQHMSEITSKGRTCARKCFFAEENKEGGILNNRLWVHTAGP